jgi:hypothetical protein
MRLLLKNITIFINSVLALSLFLTLLGYYKIKGLPDQKLISPILSQEPSQTKTTRKKFEFNYQGQDYVVEPLYDYEISGLIVTHNNIASLGDAYHTSKSVDIKDLCVIWGDNFNNNIHKQLKFWSEAWTCFLQYDNYDIGSKFRDDQLSNNHLLSDRSWVREKIKKAKIGDQVKFSGMLVSYYPKRFPDMARKSSTIRTDDGNGACEVVFVEDFQIIKVWQKQWADIYQLSKKILFFLMVLKILSFLIFPYLEYQAMGGD